MAYPTKLLNAGEHVVVSTRTHVKALILPGLVVLVALAAAIFLDRVFGCGTLVVSDASTDGRVELHDIPRVEEVQLQVSEELHRLAGGDRRDDGA